MAVLELLARATEAWVVAAGNEHLVNRSSRIVDGVSRRCTAGKPVRMDVASGWRYQFYERLMSRIGILVSLDYMTFRASTKETMKPGWVNPIIAKK